ncbi:CaiB/BaiF CoA transferase family protein [Nonomuraea aurantiaca]|jgi:crotonobetainyl-CoA:carnitine CoA-transferase CaiB-like acyl-CoA transferase|uniref:CaiB/BaiF CoA transferase family protein n=1 Tax=Nonomuraea aurantiaca TaxID=2878562 RepID=UPI001CDA54F5|nr:CoA transferase [Nonomuraea aurantiaca]MCA2221813.1 CoA transferase [Nonomuraea aurantiaca]
MGVLDGYRVVDLSIAMAGPLAAMRLGDLGADVIKVEPVTGEWQRHAPAGGATGNQVNASFLSLNRNKRSLAVNLKSDEGRDIVHRLAATADVFLQNYRPGVAERLGMDHDTISGLNPRVVYVSMSGYGESGPYVTRPGQDLLLQAMSGAMLSTGRDGDPPAPAGTYAIDAITAYSAFEGALAALLHRERTGEGQRVSVNMLDAAIAVQMQELSVFTVGGVPQRRGREPHGHTYIRAPYGVFATKDGYLALGMPRLDGLAVALDLPELAGMDGHTQRDEITSTVARRLPERTTAEWLDICARHDLWAGPVYGYAELVADPQVRHNGSFVTYDHRTEGTVTTPGFPYGLSAAPPQVRRGAPLVGEHTAEILGELGYPAEHAAELVEKGVLACAD